MRKVWAIIRREFIERVRSRWFIISTVLGPLFMIAVTVLPSLLMMKGGRAQKIVIINGGAGTLAGRMQTQLSRGGRFQITIDTVLEDSVPAVQAALLHQVKEETLDGFLTLTSGTVESGVADYKARNVSSLRDIGVMESALRQSVIVERLTRRGVDPAVVQEAQGRIDLRTARISNRGGGESGETTFVLGYVVGLVLYMVILLYGINVMRSVLEEKQTRIVEVLVSSLRPFQLMMGKVIGVGGVGLFQFAIWIGTSWLVMQNRAKIFSALHLDAAASTGPAAFQLPSIGGLLLAICVAYFLFGYLLYSALFAAVGSTCTSETEAQQAQQPVMMLLVFSLIVSFSAMSDPTGSIATTGSMIPFSAPIIMPVRVATSDVPPQQILLSLGIMAASSFLVIWGAARIYRIGILMYGKRPSLKELIHWARQS